MVIDRSMRLRFLHCFSGSDPLKWVNPQGRTVARSGISGFPRGGSPLAEREVSSLFPLSLPPEAAQKGLCNSPGYTQMLPGGYNLDRIIREIGLEGCWPSRKKR